MNRIGVVSLVLVICVLLINVAFLAVAVIDNDPLASQKLDPRKYKQARMSRSAEKRSVTVVGKSVVRQLDLSNDQRTMFDSLLRSYWKDARHLRREVSKAKSKLYTTMSSMNTNDTTVEKEAQYLSEKRKQLELLTSSHFRTLRKHLVLEQQTKFDTLVYQLLNDSRTGD